MSKLSKGGLVGLLYSDFNQRQKSGVWSLEDHVEDTNFIRSSQIPNNYLAVGSYDTDALKLFDMFFKTKVSTNIFNIPEEASITCIDYNYQNNMLAFGLNEAPYLKTYSTETFVEYTLSQTIPGPITCLRFNYTGDYLFVGFLEIQDNTHVLVYNTTELTTIVDDGEYIGSQGIYTPPIEYTHHSIILEYLPTCIKFTKDDGYLCIGHYGSITNEYKNATLYQYVDNTYTDISEYNLTSFELETVTDICFIEDLEYLFIASYNKPYLYCYNYDRQDLVKKYDTGIAATINSKINSLLLTKDNKKLLIGCDIDPYLYILDLTTKLILPVDSDYLTSSITSMSFSYNDQYLCITTRDSGLKVFDYTLKTLDIVDLNFTPSSTPLVSTFLFGPIVEYVEIVKPEHSISSNGDAMISVTSDGELDFTGTFLTDSITTSSPDLAAHKEIFQSQIYFSLDYQSTYITSIKTDGTLITNDINIPQNYYNNILQIGAYYSRIAILDSYGSVNILDNNAFGTEEKYYITNDMSKNIKQIAVGESVLIALTNDGLVKSSNMVTLDQITISSLPYIKQVAAGDIHISLLTITNTVLSYGDNSHEQCETDSWVDVSKVCCGDLFTIALTLSNTIYLTGSEIDTDIYDEIVSEQNVIDIFTGPTDIMLLKSDNTIMRYSI